MLAISICKVRTETFEVGFEVFNLQAEERGSSPRKSIPIILPILSSPAQREQPKRSLLPPFCQAAPRSGSSPNCCLLMTSSLLRSSSPAQRELPHLQPRPSPHQAAPRSGRSHINRFLPAAPRSGSCPRKSILPPSIEQPRASGAPPERASLLPILSSPAQRELPPKRLHPSSKMRPQKAPSLQVMNENGIVTICWGILVSQCCTLIQCA